MSVEVKAERAVFRIYPAPLVLALIVVVLSLAAGYHWLGYSRDYRNYVNIYDGIRTSASPFIYAVEPGFSLVAWLCNVRLGLDISQFLTLITFISLSLKFRLLWKYTSAPFLAVIVYVTVLYPLHEYTQVRAAISFAFAFTAIDSVLERKWWTAILLFVIALSFHASAIILVLGTILVLLLSRLKPGTIAVAISAATATASLLIARLLDYAMAAKPLIETYVIKTYEPPNPFSGQNILLFLLIASSTLFLRPWQMRKDGYFYYLSLFALTSYFSFINIPVIAHRIEEAFIFPFFLYTFRFDDYHRSRIPAVIMAMSGVWMLYEALSKGLFNV